MKIVREGRISLNGDREEHFGVPVLSRVDMFTEKLLANSDRGLDVATLSRDLIDLAMMVNAWGDIPVESWDKARFAYGSSVERLFEQALTKCSDADYLRRCCERMQMDMTSVATVQRVIARLSV